MSRLQSKGGRAIRWSYLLCVAACTTEAPTERAPSGQASGQPEEILGEVQFRLQPGSALAIKSARYEITGGVTPVRGSLGAEADGQEVSAIVSLPPAAAYRLNVSALGANQDTVCSGSTRFVIEPGRTTALDLKLQCDDRALPPSTAYDASVGSSEPRALLPDVDDSTGIDHSARRDAAISTDLGVDANVELDAAEPTPDAGTPPRPSAPVVDAGVPIKSMPPPFSKERCDACSAWECAQTDNVEREADCYKAEGFASAGPAQGIAKSALCSAVMMCAHKTGCAAHDPRDCYCGSADTGQSCARTGACREEFEFAGENTSSEGLDGAKQARGTALGVAQRLLACEAERCFEQCFPGR